MHKYFQISKKSEDFYFFAYSALHPLKSRDGCGDGCGWWIQISTLHNHQLYLQWYIERVEMFNFIAAVEINNLVFMLVSCSSNCIDIQWSDGDILS